MKSNKLPSSSRTDIATSSSPLQQNGHARTQYLTSANRSKNTNASNDANYVNCASRASRGMVNNGYVKKSKSLQHDCNNTVENKLTSDLTVKHDRSLESPTIDGSYKKATKNNVNSLSKTDIPIIDNAEKTLRNSSRNRSIDSNTKYASVLEATAKPAAVIKSTFDSIDSIDSIDIDATKTQRVKPTTSEPQLLTTTTALSNSDIPERVFMNGLIKHTIIALAIIIPLAAFSAYAAVPELPAANLASTIGPSAIIYNNATTPTTVDKTDLEQYTGTWYEIGRLPMYFQRKCARDVTATYTDTTDGSGIVVVNKCTGADGADIAAEGLAKPDDNSGSKLRVTFLPSWIRWLPFGRADYWILARDANYQTALVGTPDKDYLWLLARTPDITQQTYTKYRQIAQQQGYNLKEFKLTAQSSQTVNLIP